MAVDKTPHPLKKEHLFAIEFFKEDFAELCAKHEIDLAVLSVVINKQSIEGVIHTTEFLNRTGLCDVCSKPFGETCKELAAKMEHNIRHLPHSHH